MPEAIQTYPASMPILSKPMEKVSSPAVKVALTMNGVMAVKKAVSLPAHRRLLSVPPHPIAPIDPRLTQPPNHALCRQAIREAPKELPKPQSDLELITKAKSSLEAGFKPKAVFRNLAPAELYEMVSRGQRMLSSSTPPASSLTSPPCDRRL
jgi:hypothetical protein